MDGAGSVESVVDTIASDVGARHVADAMEMDGVATELEGLQKNGVLKDNHHLEVWPKL